MNSELWTALITTGLGVFGLEIVKRGFELFNKSQKIEVERSKRKEKTEEEAEAKLRKVLEDQAENSKRELARLTEDLATRNNKYYELVRDYAVLQEKYKGLEQDLAVAGRAK